MYQKSRLENIMKTLDRQGYMTTRQLMNELHYSCATINRDLNLLEKQGLLKRQYGGAEKIEQSTVPLVYRYDKMRNEKRKLAKKAADFVTAGDTIFIDGTTTTQIIGEYISNTPDIKVITNNMSLATYLSQYGIEVICLGGEIFEAPHMLLSDITIQNAMHFHADKLFFSTGGITPKGQIWDSSYMLMHQVMAKNSDKVYYLVDHEKFDRPVNKFLFDLNNVDCVICDFDFDDDVIQQFNKTKFINVNNKKSHE